MESPVRCRSLVLLFTVVASACDKPAAPPPSNPAPAPTAPVAEREPTLDDRVEDLLGRMTREEKIAYVGGDRDFFVRPIERLGIPEIKTSDGPAGCRNWGESTAYPAPIGIASSFDPALAERVGHAIGRDCRARGVHVLLAPGVNIQRAPLNGRNFEYLGEDPHLAAVTATATIRGVQAEGVLSTVKHFAANNQEWDRHHVSSEVDERTLREIYFPAFEAAVRDAQVGSVMTAYNLLNGIHCSHHSWLIHDVLKHEWGFRGFVMSDWGAVHDTLGAAIGGCDLEMPSGKYMSLDHLAPMLEDGRVTMPMIDDKVRRMLRTFMGAGFFDREQKRADLPLDDPQSVEVALEAARASIVLLRNRGDLLPLDRAAVRRIAVIGPNAHPAVHGGSGSAYVTPFHTTSVLDGIRNLHPNALIEHHPGMQERLPIATLGQPSFAGELKREIFAGKGLQGDPVATSVVDRIDFHGDGKPPAEGLGPEDYSIRWTGKVKAAKRGSYQVITNADDGIRVFVDGTKVIDDFTDHAARSRSATLALTRGEHQIVVEYFQGILGAVAQVGFGPAPTGRTFTSERELVGIAGRADVVIVCVGFGQSTATNSAGIPFSASWPEGWTRDVGIVEAEDNDRLFALPEAQVRTIAAVTTANPRTIVIVNAGGGVDPSGWLDSTAALFWAWYPGQEGGTAIAELLFGDQAPSAKLPITLAQRFEDYPSARSYLVNDEQTTPYAEGTLVGYRGFDANRVEPLFPFGFGLTYTTFAYSDLVVSSRPGREATVTFTVTNTGPRPGHEVAQVYVAPPFTEIPTRAPQELRGFAKVALRQGEHTSVSIALDERAFSYWENGWQVSPGPYAIHVGSSSRDILLTSPIELSGD